MSGLKNALKLLMNKEILDELVTTMEDFEDRPKLNTKQGENRSFPVSSGGMISEQSRHPQFLPPSYEETCGAVANPDSYSSPSPPNFNQRRPESLSVLYNPPAGLPPSIPSVDFGPSKSKDEKEGQMNVYDLVFEISKFSPVFFTDASALSNAVGRNYNDIVKLIKSYDSIFKTFHDVDLNKIVVELCPSLQICQDHLGPTGCVKQRCSDIHICLQYTAGSCCQKNCLFGHILKSNHNNAIFRSLFLDKIPDHILNKLLQKVFVGPARPKVCLKYQEQKCQLKENCTDLHICQKYVETLGCCPNIGQCCPFNHKIRSAQCKAILDKFDIPLNDSPRDIMKKIMVSKSQGELNKQGTSASKEMSEAKEKKIGQTKQEAKSSVDKVKTTQLKKGIKLNFNSQVKANKAKEKKIGQTKQEAESSVDKVKTMQTKQEVKSSVHKVKTTQTKQEVKSSVDKVKTTQVKKGVKLNVNTQVKANKASRTKRAKKRKAKKVKSKSLIKDTETKHDVTKIESNVALKSKTAVKICQTNKVDKANETVYANQFYGNVKTPMICYLGILGQCLFEKKSGCNFLHAFKKYHWQFGTAKKWFNFVPYHVYILEKQFQNASVDTFILPKLDRKDLKPEMENLISLLGSNDLNVDFRDMTVGSIGVPSKYHIRHLTTPSSVIGGIPLLDTVFHWYYYEHNKGWLPFDKKYTRDIETAYQTENADLCGTDSKDFVFFLEIKGDEYEINFSKMRQENRTTNQIQNLRRRPASTLTGESMDKTEFPNVLSVTEKEPSVNQKPLSSQSSMEKNKTSPPLSRVIDQVVSSVVHFNKESTCLVGSDAQSSDDTKSSRLSPTTVELIDISCVSAKETPVKQTPKHEETFSKFQTNKDISLQHSFTNKNSKQNSAVELEIPPEVSEKLNKVDLCSSSNMEKVSENPNKINFFSSPNMEKVSENPNKIDLCSSPNMEKISEKLNKVDLVSSPNVVDEADMSYVWINRTGPFYLSLNELSSLSQKLAFFPDEVTLHVYNPKLVPFSPTCILDSEDELSSELKELLSPTQVVDGNEETTQYLIQSLGISHCKIEVPTQFSATNLIYPDQKSDGSPVQFPSSSSKLLSNTSKFESAGPLHPAMSKSQLSTKAVVDSTSDSSVTQNDSTSKHSEISAYGTSEDSPLVRATIIDKKPSFNKESTHLSESPVTLPKNWNKMEEQEKYKLVNLIPFSNEYKSTQQLIHFSLPLATIKSVSRIQNPTLWKQFKNDEARLKKKYKNSLLNIQRLFATIDSAILKDVCLNNLDYVKHTTDSVPWFGQGSYFYNSAAEALERGSIHAGGQKMLLVANVIVGKVTVGAPGMKEPPENPALGVPFDTTVDSVTGPTVFVKYNVSEYYPSHVVQVIME